MKTVMIIVSLFILAGCNPAVHIDAEYGKANQAAQDQQVAYPEAPFAGSTPEGMEGITAEEVMSLHNKTYAEKPTETDTLSFGLLGDQNNSN